jgi:hypothetical protein
LASGRADADDARAELDDAKAELAAIKIRLELLSAQLRSARFKVQEALQSSSEAREVARARDRLARDRDRLAFENEGLRADLKTLHSSRWWRITRPLRRSGRRGQRAETRDLEGLRGLLDGAWYLQTNADVHRSRADPWIHFLSFGLAEGRDPGPWFDSDWYLFRYPDVGNSGVIAFEHFLRTGLEEGRFPNPRWESQATSCAEGAGGPPPRCLDDLLKRVGVERGYQQEAGILGVKGVIGTPLDAIAWTSTVSARLSKQVGDPVENPR